jgi:type VI protein secretion system component Hcp
MPIFMEFDGIKGESNGKIMLESFSWGVTNPNSPAAFGGGGGAGKAVFQDFSFTSIAGSEAVDLFAHAATPGKTISNGLLTITSMNDKVTPMITIKFETVLISTYKIMDGPLNVKFGDGSVRPTLVTAPPTQHVSFSFMKYTFQTPTANTSGDLGTGTIG